MTILCIITNVRAYPADADKLQSGKEIIKMEEKKPLYKCIFMLKGMYRNVVDADSIADLYMRLSGTSVVEDMDVSGMDDSAILDSIYAQSVKTTGRLSVYKLNPDFDPEEEEDFDDNEYILCKNGVV